MRVSAIRRQYGWLSRRWSELGDASRGTSPTDTQGLSVELCQNKKTDTLPSGRWQDKQTPTTISISFIWGGIPLARTVDTLLTDACGRCIIASKSTYGGVHIGNVLIIHHFFERHFAIGFSEKNSMSIAKKIFRPMAQPSQPFYIHTSWQINNT